MYKDIMRYVRPWLKGINRRRALHDATVEHGPASLHIKHNIKKKQGITNTLALPIDKMLYN
jgi:hypothetical protein